MSVAMTRGDYSNVPDEQRTPDRDRAAKEIEEWRDSGMLPMSAAEMERQGEYSAQHYRNTLQSYFEGEDLQSGGGGTGDTLEQGRLSIDVPDDVENVEDYLRGYVNGYVSSRSSD